MATPIKIDKCFAISIGILKTNRTILFNLFIFIHFYLRLSTFIIYTYSDICLTSTLWCKKTAADLANFLSDSVV